MEPKQTDTRPTLKEGCERLSATLRNFGCTAEEFKQAANEFNKAAQKYSEAIKSDIIENHDTDKKI